MNKFIYFGENLRHLCSLTSTSEQGVIMSLYRFAAFHVPPFYIQLCYFILSSLLGFVGLKVSKPRTPLRPGNLDLFFTSVSAATVSSMTAVEMEVFSDSQLILMTFLMFIGGEVFTSFLSLVFAKINITLENRVRPPNQIELPYSINNNQKLSDPNDDDKLRYNSIRCLGYVVLGYLAVSHLVGSSLVCLYMSVVPSARQVLKNKGLKVATFSLFTIVSTFASCGFVPTNENMTVFKNNSGLLLLITPYIFLGNTLYAPCLKLVLWVMHKVTRRQEFSYILRNYREMGFEHLMSRVHCWLLIATVFGFNLIQWVLFCSMEWDNMEGLNIYQKLVASLFQTANARHAGESVFDLSSISSALLVLFILMMYLPPYTTFVPIEIKEQKTHGRKEERMSLVESVLFSQLSYLVIFVILICITEREGLRDDPLNFNVLNITLEVISAYGNVGLSTGYSCKRQLKPNGMCEDSWVGFSGRWSGKGKFILILVMFFGRLKKFSVKAGKAWTLA